MSIRCLRYIIFTFWVGVCSGVLPLLAHAESRTWKYVHELSEHERRALDPRTDTPRDATLPYLPAEPYPFTAPYTAEEIGYRMMEFPHMAWWNHVQIEDYGAITHTGYLFSGKIIILAMHDSPEGLEGYLRKKPGEVFTRWLAQDTAPPENLGTHDSPSYRSAGDHQDRYVRLLTSAPPGPSVSTTAPTGSLSRSTPDF